MQLSVIIANLLTAHLQDWLANFCNNSTLFQVYHYLTETAIRQHHLLPQFRVVRPHTVRHAACLFLSANGDLLAHHFKQMDPHGWVQYRNCTHFCWFLRNCVNVSVQACGHQYDLKEEKVCTLNILFLSLFSSHLNSSRGIEHKQLQA